jgi:ferritin-like metal-binding protein YciE
MAATSWDRNRRPVPRAWGFSWYDALQYKDDGGRIDTTEGELPRFVTRSIQYRPFPEDRKEDAMGLLTKEIESMDDLLLHGLQDIYYAENQIVKSLPKLIDKATNRDLTRGLQDHLEETKSQIGRLDQVFKKLGQEPEGKKCPAIDGLITEADEVAGEVADKEVLDAAIVGAAQSVEHYEIARYGTADRVGRGPRPRRHHPAAQHEPQRGKGGGQETFDSRAP